MVEYAFIATFVMVAASPMVRALGSRAAEAFHAAASAFGP